MLCLRCCCSRAFFIRSLSIFSKQYDCLLSHMFLAYKANFYIVLLNFFLYCIVLFFCIVFYTILTVLLFCTEKYEREVDNAARACEGCCILTEGLYCEVRTAKQLVLDLLTGAIIFKGIEWKLSHTRNLIRFLLNLTT